MKRSLLTLGAAALMAFAAAPAFAWHLEGRVYCEGTGLPLSGVTLKVFSTDGGTPVSEFVTTNDIGYYFTWLPDTPRCYTLQAMLDPGESVVSPADGEYSFCTTEANFAITRDWLIASPSCGEERCWLTGGGTKFSAITGGNVGDAGPRHSFGGNVNPGCNTESGEGGQWNDVAHTDRLHFQGWAMEVVRCGNVDGIPPGSESPETPFNFIEFQGTGTLKGIKGNKVDYGTVYFFARCEDRNEPGSNGQSVGTLKDRYFLHVFADPSNPAGSTLLLVDVDGDPETVDPLTITNGNLQIHISSCDTPPSLALAPARQETSTEAPAAVIEVSLPSEIWLAPTSPNPAREGSRMRFGLPRESDVNLTIYDVRGRRVRDILSARVPAGEHSASWDLRDRSGNRAPYGIYFARLNAAGRVFSRTIVLAP